ncbi:MAG: DUF58 domain-containing protein [Anaerolineales bacterium]
MSPERWLPLLGIVFLVGAIANIPYVTTFSAALVVLLVITSWWRNHSLDGVKYRRRPYYRRAFPGEHVPLQIEIENNKPLPLSWLRIEDPWPMAVGPEDDDILAPSHLPGQGLLKNIFSLRWFEKTNRSYTLLFRKRGLYQVGPATLQSGDVFGMYELSRKEAETEYLTVFPEILPLERLGLPAEDPFGDRRSRRRIFEDPNQPMGVREYRSEDGFRRVHWPATARTGQLQVKVFQPTSAQVAMICLNTSTFDRHWEGINPELLEHLMSVSATLANRYIQDGYQVGLISNGCLAHADRPLNIPPGRSPKQLGALLEALAGITPMVMVPFEEFLIREMPRVPYGASLLVISAVTPPVLMETLARLKRRNRQITLLSLAEEPPREIPGMEILHRPFQGQDEVRMLLNQGMNNER